jgi:Tol biopolymer transport system component
MAMMAWRSASLYVAAVIVAISSASGSDGTRAAGTIAVVAPADFKTVYLVSAGTGAATRVRAPDTVIGLQVDLSRDGSRIAFGGSRGVWIFPRANSRLGRRVVPVSSSAAFLPDWVVWSPNGRKLAFTRGGTLFTVDSNGKHLRRIHRGNLYAPDWSPTGNELFLVRNPSRRTGVGLIQSIAIDGTSTKTIIRGGHPDVSPSGSQLAFARRDGIYVVPIRRGGQPKRIVGRGDHPEWSPDGRYLAFTREVKCGDAGCEGRIFIVPAGGGTPRVIGPQLFEIGPLSWSR